MYLIGAFIPFLLAYSSFAQSLDASKLTGNWTGSGKFYNLKFQAEFGSLPFEFQFESDLTLSGSIGGARILPTKPRINGRRLDFYAILQGDIRPEKVFRKDHLVLLVTETDGKTMSADFHLKTNFTWDWTMRQGRVEASHKE